MSLACLTWPSLTELYYNQYEADDKSNNLLNLCGVEAQAPISLMHADFTSKQFAQRLEQSNYCMFNMCKKTWVVEFLTK